MFELPRRARHLAAVLALACLPATLIPATASAEPPADEVASGPGWHVTRVAGGFRVTLDLAGELPVTASAPTLSADGRILGPATESEDGKSLSLVTTDPSVADATSVTTDAVPDTSVAPSAARGRGHSMPDVAPEVLRTDPSTPGPYRVSEAVYDFGDQAIPLLNIGGIRGEMTGKIYLPDGRGEKPVVIFLHGRHSSCYGSGPANPARWPCRATSDSTAQRFTIPSYLGYDAPARALASNGYAVVSISANAVNANDNQLAADYGAQARGQLILDTLDMLKKADAGQRVVYHDAFTGRDVALDQALTGAVAPRDLVRRLDLGNVGIMGHSRGGEGVTAASTLNDALPVWKQYGIKAVLPLAPVDYDRISVPNAALATILPYCDGDVENLMGQHIVDDSRHNFADDVLRSAVLVMGTNHNFFNTIWTPGGWPASTGDDWSTSGPGAGDPVCDPAAATTTRLTPAQQVQVGATYMAGFFRVVLGGEKQFLPLFDGSATAAPATTFARITSAATLPARSRTDIATFERPDPAVRVSGDATAEVCASMGGTGGVALPQTAPFCATTLDQAALPHWSPALWAFNIPSSPMLHMKWTSATGQVRVAVPPAARNVRRYQQLSVKIAADESVATATDLVVSVTDGRRTWSSPVSKLNPVAVTRLPGVTSPWLRKVILQQVTIPVSSLTGLNTGDLREVRFTGAAEPGGVYISDLSAENRAVGARSPAQQTTVNMVPARAEEGAAPGTTTVAAVLSERTHQPVTAYVSVFGSATGRAAATMRKVTFFPGQTCVPVQVPTFGDALPSSTPSTSFKVSVTNTSGAVMGDKGFNTLTVREDDGVTNGTPAPEVGVPGDVCAEYAASQNPGRLLVQGSVVSGAPTTLRALGYRPGESVEFRLDATSLGRVLADRHGTVSLTATIPPGTPSGFVTLTATGAGSAYGTTAKVKVRAAH
ncbi:alpha/beta hydrolase [Sphaerisporangium aureirubrum]|uniref:Alpha/beta hydrolase n=1 Tax=Sphaerisporangium aureirubrum TaxID=1544736 RepID=A0ABW1NJJ4_9ACTN